MAKSRIAYQNGIVAGVTITASSELTNRPAAYLASPARWKKWRSSTTTGDQWVKFDLGVPTSLQAFLLADWRAHAGGSIRVQANATDAWGAPTVDQVFTLPTVNPTKVIAVFLGAAVSLRWVRIYFTNTAAASDYVELGVVFAGPYYQPTFNLSDGFRLQRVDPSLVVASDGGNESAQIRTPYFVASCQYVREPDADKDAFVAVTTAVGIHTPFFYAIDPDDPDLILYGRRSEDLDVQHEVLTQYSIPFVVKEVL